MGSRPDVSPEPRNQHGLAGGAALVGALFRRNPTREIPPTRTKSLIVIAAGVVALLVIGLVFI
jgi:hypothetical protein